MYLRGGSDDSGRVVTLENPEFDTLAGVQFLRYVEGAVRKYYVRSFRFDRVGGCMLFRVPTLSVNVLSHFGPYKIAEKMSIDPVLVALASYQMKKIDSSSFGVFG